MAPVMRMVLFTFVLTLLPVQALAAVAGRETPGDFFTYYYRAPDPGRVSPEFAKLDSEKRPMPADAFWRMGMFLSEIFAKHPEVAARLVRNGKNRSREGRDTIAFAVCQAGLKNKAAYVDQLLPGKERQTQREQLKTTRFQPLAEIALEDPGMVEALWGGFMASANIAYVERVVSALGYSLDAEGKKMFTPVQAAARDTLTANAKLHPLVLASCRREAGNEARPKETREELERIIESATEQ